MLSVCLSICMVSWDCLLHNGLPRSPPFWSGGTVFIFAFVLKRSYSDCLLQFAFASLDPTGQSFLTFRRVLLAFKCGNVWSSNGRFFFLPYVKMLRKHQGRIEYFVVPSIAGRTFSTTENWNTEEGGRVSLFEIVSGWRNSLKEEKLGVVRHGIGSFQLSAKENINCWRKYGT